MAKRKTKNKSFAARRAAEAEAAQKKDAIQSSVRTGVFSLVGVAVLIVGVYFLVQFLNNNPVDTEPAAVDSGNGVIDTGSASESAAESEPDDSMSDDGSMAEAHSEPTGALLNTDRALAELEPLERNDYFSEAPEMMIDTSKSYQAHIVTDQGEMLIELFDDQAPITVNSFIFLATQGFYDGVNFHRVIPNFMAQGGDPSGTGAGGPGYNFVDEFDPNLRFDRRGLLAMANAGPGTNGSQFFITHVPTPHLNDAHTIFGELISGDDTLSAIPVTGEAGSPTIIERIDIYES